MSSRKRSASVQKASKQLKKLKLTPPESPMDLDLIEIVPLLSEQDLLLGLEIAMRNELRCAMRLGLVCKNLAKVAASQRRKIESPGNYPYTLRHDPAFTQPGTYYVEQEDEDGQMRWCSKELPLEREPRASVTINMPDPNNNFCATGELMTFHQSAVNYYQTREDNLLVPLEYRDGILFHYYTRGIVMVDPETEDEITVDVKFLHAVQELTRGKRHGIQITFLPPNERVIIGTQEHDWIMNNTRKPILHSLCYFEEGSLIGESYIYHVDGVQLWRRNQFKGGDCDGKEWHFNDRGICRYEYSCSNGYYRGPFIKYDDQTGEIKERGSYNESKSPNFIHCPVTVLYYAYPVKNQHYQSEDTIYINLDVLFIKLGYWHHIKYSFLLCNERIN